MELNNNESANRYAEEGGFKNRTILITGATGFLGKVLLEKILRTCPLVARIYLMIRVKKGKNPQERLKELFSNPIFDLLKKTTSEDALYNQVIAISSDMMDPNLALSAEDRQRLAEEVEIVYHSAATIRFDEPLTKAVLLNTRATKLMLELAKDMKKLAVYCHVSTAYCHTQETLLCEKTYPPPCDPHAVIKIVEWLDEATVTKIQKHILKGVPNTYSFTKALGEDLVAQQMENLPVIIVRPSIVIPTWLEPLKGWTDNINGPVGLLTACGKGILRTIYLKPIIMGDFIPVDVAANLFMMATFDYLRYKERRVFNCTTYPELKVTWNDIIEKGRNIMCQEVPFNWVAWYPGGSLKTSRFLNAICVVLQHYVPAIIGDTLILLTGNKPVLWRIQRRLSKGCEVVDYYINKQWYFVNDNVMAARALMNKTENGIYKVDFEDFDLIDYLINCAYGARRYVLKETDDTLPTARRHLKIMWFVDKCFIVLMLIAFVYFTMRLFNVV